MIKPITFQGTVNFKASLYALEIRSRFIDQANAHGFYTNYGDELNNITTSTTTITIGTGAFVVNGRMSEVTSQEVVPVNILNNGKGYIVAIINSYQINQENNCRFEARTAPTFEELNSTLTKQDTYAFDADTSNKIYELPIYKFEMNSNGTIVNVVKLLKPIADYNTVFELANSANSKAEAANTKSDAAVLAANSANTKSDNAVSVANSANTKAEAANTKSDAAVLAANSANAKSDEATLKVEELEEQIGERQGTTVTVNSTPQSSFEAGGLLDIGDIFTINGGGA